MKRVLLFVLGALVGVLLGVPCGYYLRGSLAAPFGSKHGPERVLTSELRLDESYFFAPEAPPVSGTLRPGSRLWVDWRKSNAAYISIATVVPQDVLDQCSRSVASGDSPSR